MLSSITRAGVLAALLAVASLASGCGGDDDNPANPNPTRELNSGSFSPTQTFAHSFASPNAYPYHCTIHPSMTGSVTVADAATDTAVTVTITGFAFSPAVVTVKTGGNVYWVNGHNTNHTVTSD